MELADVNSINELRPTGWGDLSELYKYNVLSPYCDPLKVIVDDRIVGVGNSILNEDTAWLALINVHAGYRNRGIGTIITKALIERLHRHKVQTILLDATDLGYPVYKKVGFEVVTDHLHFSGELSDFVPERPANIVPFEEKHKSALLALDRIATGENREVVLLEHIASSLVYVSGNKVHGAYFPDLTRGLIIADEPGAGIALMKLRLKDHNTCMMPKENVHAINYLLSTGFKHVNTSKRMWLGRKREWCGAYIYNVTGGMRG